MAFNGSESGRQLQAALQYWPADFPDNGVLFLCPEVGEQAQTSSKLNSETTPPNIRGFQ